VTEDLTITPVGEASPMDRQRLCIAVGKTGHITGAPCGKYHHQHIHVFDARLDKIRCFEYPKCSKTLARRPSTTTGKHHRMFEEYIVAWEGD
jgi:hypothetical protein